MFFLSLFVVDGVLRITNVTFGFYNDICSRRDIAIQVSQNNDDGQHPVITSQLYLYNTSSANKIFNGRPNIGLVNPSDCVGKKKFTTFLFLFQIEF